MHPAPDLETVMREPLTPASETHHEALSNVFEGRGFAGTSHYHRFCRIGSGIRKSSDGRLYIVLHHTIASRRAETKEHSSSIEGLHGASSPGCMRPTIEILSPKP